MTGLLPDNDLLVQFSQLFQQRTSLSNMQAHWQQYHWKETIKLGFSNHKHEDWKYTSLDRLLQYRFNYAQKLKISKQQCDCLALPLDSHRLVFLNGRFIASLSDNIYESYQVSSLVEQKNIPVAVHAEVFLHLTESLAQESLLIRLAAGKKSNKPLYLLHISSGQTDNQNKNIINSSYYRHHLLIEENAKIQVIEHFVSLNNQSHFTCARLTISLGDNAQLTHYKLAFENQHSYHFSHNDLILGNHAYAHSDSFLLGANLTRHHTSAQLNGKGSYISINSLLLPFREEICDSRTYLEHNKGHCHSQQLHKTIVYNNGKAVFDGILKVAPHAVRTDGKITNNNLLLSKQAEVNTKPRLEIYTDDVKCSHGATVGYIDIEQVSYLRSRGISKTKAKQMIIFAFAAELTESLKNKIIHQQVVTRITKRLKRIDI
ncbi:Fe-S cluster assembly protein SufD [Candidatus Fukatsuia anoeciicola]|uniref:Fe-S cluster assembly protein SufD n=1 Tax=Candidatus Fukatsuia anoeciicola TaxID=2994492 RepID=UPI003463A3AE